MNQPIHFISCDWGTTNFRLRAVATKSLSVLAERTGQLGIRGLNARFLQGRETDRLGFFTAYLKTQLMELPDSYHSCPIVISGMASADIGMKNLPYGDLPLEATGRSLLFQDIQPGQGQLIRLISGLRDANGMMRGEEIQALGLLQIMATEKVGVLLLPGTHSKHLTYRDGQFTHFTSYMTGELFEVISRHSILANSVASGKWNARTGDRFKDGVLAGFNDGFTHHLFSIRAAQVLRQTESVENFYQLSGLLIGDELSHLPNDKSHKIYLAGSGPLLRLYRFALESLGLNDRVTVYDDSVLDKALLAGQKMMLLRQQ